MNNRIERQKVFDTIEFVFDSVNILPTTNELQNLFEKGYEYTHKWINERQNCLVSK